MRTLSHLLLALGLLSGACAESRTATPDVPREETARWTCPVGWVSAPSGGCGPAYVLCAPDAGGDPAECRLAESAAQRADGGVPLHRLADGGLGGGWIEPGEPGGPPAADWMPSGLPDPEEIRAETAWTCPEGWTRTPEGVCDPRLSSTCPVGTAPLPGGRCTPTGVADCPSGDEPTLPSGATGRVIYVRPGTTVATPTGERAAPFATLSRALETAPDGAWVLVGAGDLSESVRVTRAVHVVGLCAARTRLLAEGTEPVVNAISGGAALDLRGVTLRGGTGGLWASEGATVEADRVVIERVGREGVRAEGDGTRIHLRDAVVRDTRTETGGAHGYGMSARMGATLTAQRTALVGNTAVGALAATQSTLTLTEVSVLGTLDPRNGDPSVGVFAQDGATLDATRIAAVGNAGGGVGANNPGTHVNLRASYVANNTAGRGGTGVGAGFGEGAQATLAQCSFVGNAYSGVWTGGAGTSATLEDITIRETRREGTGPGLLGVGLRVVYGASVTGRRVRIEANASTGILAQDASVGLTTGVIAFNGDNGVACTQGWQLTLSRFLVEENSPSNMAFGRGVARLHGVHVRSVFDAPRTPRGIELTSGTLEGDHVVIHGASDLGLFATNGAHLTLTDSLVHDTRFVPGNPGACGLQLQNGATASITRSVFENNAYLAITVRDDGSSLERLEDSVIRGTYAIPTLPIDRAGGRGIEVAERGRGVIHRTLFQSNANVAIAVGDDGALTLDAVVIEDTHTRRDGLYGIGLGVGERARVEASRCVISRSRGSGLLVNNGSLSLSGCIVRDTLGDERNGALGQGLTAVYGARVELRGVAFVRSRHQGVICGEAETHCSLWDVAIFDTEPSNFVDLREPGFGLGLTALGATVDAHRVALVRNNGASIISTSSLQAPEQQARMDLEDVFVQTVRPQYIRYMRPFGEREAYGLHVASRSVLNVSRALVTDAEFGFFQSGGTLTLRDAVLSGNTTLAGGIAPGISPGAARFERVSNTRNRNDAIQREVTSTEASLPLTFPCPDAGRCEL